jgi:TPR repeat protein
MSASNWLDLLTQNPAATLAGLAWPISIGLVSYWLKRLDDAKTISLATKRTAILMTVVAVGATGAALLSRAPQIQIPLGPSRWAISRQDWDCMQGTPLWAKYRLESRRLEIIKAAAHDPDARYLLGLSYVSGLGVAKDPGRARSNLQGAAEAGSLRAMATLGAVLVENPKPDVEKGLTWLKRSSDAGLGLADYTLGYLYDTPGSGLGTNTERALYWFERAAAQGCPQAYFEAGVINARGVRDGRTPARSRPKGSYEGGRLLPPQRFQSPRLSKPRDADEAARIGSRERTMADPRWRRRRARRVSPARRALPER